MDTESVSAASGKSDGAIADEGGNESDDEGESSESDSRNCCWEDHSAYNSECFKCYYANEHSVKWSLRAFCDAHETYHDDCFRCQRAFDPSRHPDAYYCDDHDGRVRGCEACEKVNADATAAATAAAASSEAER